jgi:hypothetical protein
MKLPKGVQERMQPLVRRMETFLKEFEWTWTKAVVAALALWAFGITFIGLLPSYWLYLAGQKLNGVDTPKRFLWFELRDAIAAGLFSVPFGLLVVVPYFLQKWRRRLRSESESRPTGGYR